MKGETAVIIYGAYYILFSVTVGGFPGLTIFTLIWFFVHLFMFLKGIFSYNTVEGDVEYVDSQKDIYISDIIYNLIGCVIVSIGYFFIRVQFYDCFKYGIFCD